MVVITTTGNSLIYLTAGIGVGFGIVLTIAVFVFITKRSHFQKSSAGVCDAECIQEIEAKAIKAKSSDSSTSLLDEPTSKLKYDTFPGCSKEVEATLTHSLAAALQSTNSFEKNEVPDFEESVHPPQVVSDEDEDCEHLESYSLDDFIADQPSTSGASYGSLKIAISYFLDQNELLVTVIEGIDLPPHTMATVLNVGLLPGRMGARISRSWRDVQFDKTFRIAIRPDDIVNTNLRFWFTLDTESHDLQTSSADDLFVQTEAIHDLADTDEDILGPVIYTLHLEPIKQEVSALCDSAILLSPRPEEPAANVPAVLVGLMYIATAGKLVVSVLKARGVSVFNELPDTFVKVTAVSPYGDEIAKYKTKMIKQRASPLFDESFVFQVPNSELDYVSITLSVYCLLGVWRRRVLIGWLNLGAKVGEPECETHWADMIDAVDDTIARWHSLIEP